MANLYPVPEQVKSYLDNWVRYVDELETKVAQLGRSYVDLEQSSGTEITKLRTELSNLAAPLHEQIGQLEDRLRASDRYSIDLASERNAAVERLAPALEIDLKTPGLTLLGLVNEALVLIDEAKKMLRENL